MPRKTDYLLPEDSDEILSMPNIEKEISEEINRLTLSLIQDVREIFNSGIDYNSIEYIEDELEEVVPINVILFETRQQLLRSIQNSIKKPGGAGYLAYFNSFKVNGYDQITGKAKVELNLEVNTTLNVGDVIQIYNIRKGK